MLDAAMHGRAAIATTTKDGFLLLQWRAVPAFDEVADDAHGLIAAVACPFGLLVTGIDPHHVLHQAAVVCRRVGGAIAETKVVARTLGRAVGARRHDRHRAFLFPAQHQHAGGVLDDVTQGVNGGALGVGTELQGNITVAAIGIQRIVGERDHALQVTGFDRAQPEAVIKQRGTDRQRNGQPVRVDVGAEDAGIRRWVAWVTLLIGAALSQKSHALGQRAQQALQTLAISHQHIKAGQHANRRARGNNALLLDAIKRVGLMGSRAGWRIGHLCGAHLLVGQRAAAQCSSSGTDTRCAQALQKALAVHAGKRTP